MTAPRDSWLDEEAGPLVRPYTMTHGRTEPATGTAAGLIDLVTTVEGAALPPGHRLGPEHRDILGRAAQPVAVADLAADLGLPLGVIRVLLGDLAQLGMIQVRTARPRPSADPRLLREVIEGLRAL
jgi:Protein of unknown function (DUF742)